MQHPNIIAEASSKTIRAICRLSSLLISQARLVLSPHVDDAGPSSSLMSSSHVCVSHTCIMCKNICLGPIGDNSKYQFVFEDDTLDTHTKTTHLGVREEGYVETWDPSVSVVHVYIFLLWNM